MIIALLNRSMRYNNNLDLLRLMATAVNQQLNTQVAPAWGMVPWTCVFYEDASKVPAGSYRLWVLDNADQAGALGYHAQDPYGQPYGRVFVQPIISAGGTDTVGSLSVSATISHEACEIMGNPEINSWRQMASGNLTAQELCDAVEDDFYNISVKGKQVSVSNFLLPAWFDYAPEVGSKFDYLGKLKAPFTMTKGGYLILMTKGKISSIFGSTAAANHFAKNTSKFHAAARGVRIREMMKEDPIKPEDIFKAIEIQKPVAEVPAAAPVIKPVVPAVVKPTAPIIDPSKAGEAFNKMMPNRSQLIEEAHHKNEELKKEADKVESSVEEVK